MPGAVTRELSNTDGLIARLAEGYADRPISPRTCAFCGKEHKTYTDDTAETCSQLCAENRANKRRRRILTTNDARRNGALPRAATSSRALPNGPQTVADLKQSYPGRYAECISLGVT